jgi:hypothetical protein
LSFLIGVASIAVSYPLGIFVDEITDAVFDGIIQKTKKIHEISDRQSVMSIQNINSFQEQYFGILRMLTTGQKSIRCVQNEEIHLVKSWI